MGAGPKRFSPNGRQIPDQEPKPEPSEIHQPLTNADREIPSADAEPSEDVCEGTPRMDEVERVKRAIESGEYNVPSSDVATKIIDKMRRK